MTGLKRNRKRHSHPTSTATMPMCSPEMLMRWFSPSGRNAAHISGDRPLRLPTARAVIRPVPCGYCAALVCQVRIMCSRNRLILNGGGV